MRKLHYGQSQVFEDMFIKKAHRYQVVVCNRGWGKTYYAATAAVTALFELINLPRSIPNKHVYIIAPTHDQVVDLYYPILGYDYGLEDMAVSASKDRGRFVFENRSEIRLLSYESIEKMRGKGPYFVVWDEISSCTKGIKPKLAWDQIIQPAISSRWSPKFQKAFKARRPGSALFIGTAKGFNFLHDAFYFYENDPNWVSFKFNYMNSPLSDLTEIDKIRENSDPISFASEYLSDFKSSGARVFYCFDRKEHVRDDLPYFQNDKEFKETVNVGIDFNINLMCASMFAIRGQEVHFLDELQGSPNTEALARALKQKFPNSRIVAYPDPTGKARKTSAPIGVTDFTILRDAGIEVYAREGSPPHVDSVKAVNRLLLNANNKKSLFFHKRVRRTIESMEKTSWLTGNADSATIDKSEGLEHFSDSVRYPVEFLYPVNHSGGHVAQSRHF